MESHHGHGDHSAPMMDHNHDQHPTSMSNPTIDTITNPHSMHNHGDHTAASSGGSDLMHHMQMAFHFGYDEVILFEKWTINSCWGLIGSMIVIIIMAALYEGLKYYREYLFWKTYNSLQYRAVTVPEKNVVAEEGQQVVQPSMFSLMHFYQTGLHILQVTLSFLLMLIFMTYNVWLCLAVVLGAAGGYFLFGWKKSVIVDVTEHCH